MIIDHARELWEKEHVDSLVADLSPKQRQVLYSVVQLKKVDNVSNPRTVEVIDCYTDVATQSQSAEAVGDRTVSRYLQHFVDIGLLRTELHQHSDGSWREYELAFGADHVLKALRNDIEHGQIVVPEYLEM